jgi:predicted transcriptional regulator
MSKKIRVGQPFTAVPNEVIRNPDISAHAKALYAYMMSRPGDWDFYVKEIQKNFAEGRDRIYKSLDELIDLGYVTKQRLRENGRFSGTVYHVGLPDNSPLTDLPDTALPDTATPTHTNKEVNKKEKKKKKYTDQFIEWYDLYPRKKGKRNAQKAYKKALKEAEHDDLVAGLRKQVRVWEDEGKEEQYIPYPATWLNGGHWMDEFDTPESKRFYDSYTADDWRRALQMSFDNDKAYFKQSDLSAIPTEYLPEGKSLEDLPLKD